jgi:wyosine [tRNA(Phe)-imidazoG37] synthetase (radical SAM superfamily)
MKIFVDKIVARFGTNIHWSLTGGEPTLNPDFIELLKYLQDKKHEISVCTNGSRSIEYMCQMYQYVDNITYSLHFEHISLKLDEYTNKAFLLEDYRKNYNLTIPKDKLGWELGQMQPKRLIVRFMALPGFSTEIKELTKLVSDYGIEKIEHRIIRPQAEFFVEENKVQLSDGSYRWKIKKPKTDIGTETKVSPNDDDKQEFTKILEREERWYDDADRQLLQDMYSTINNERKWLIGYIEQDDGSIVTENFHYNTMNFEYKTNFKGWTCYAGVTLLKVAPNGDIFIANCFQGGPLANIYTMDDSVQLPNTPVICEKTRCTDPMDLRQKKYKEEKYKDLVNGIPDSNNTGYN